MKSGRLQSWSFGEYSRSYSRLLDGQRVRVSVTLVALDLVDTTSWKLLTFHFSVKEIRTQVTSRQKMAKVSSKRVRQAALVNWWLPVCRGIKTFAA